MDTSIDTLIQIANCHFGLSEEQTPPMLVLYEDPLRLDCSKLRKMKRELLLLRLPHAARLRARAALLREAQPPGVFGDALPTLVSLLCPAGFCSWTA